MPPVAPGLYFAAESLLYVAAIGLLGRRFLETRRAREPIDLGLVGAALVMLATVLVLASVAIGRVSSWSPGLHLHYGYLATILPLASWVVVSTLAPRRVALAAGLALVAMYAGIYGKNVGLRREQLLQREQDRLRIVADLDSGMAVVDFVERNNRLLTYVDDENARRRVEQAVSMLREAGVQPWARLAP
jgi:hypothetical protein